MLKEKWFVHDGLKPSPTINCTDWFIYTKNLNFVA